MARGPVAQLDIGNKQLWFVGVGFASIIGAAIGAVLGSILTVQYLQQQSFAQEIEAKLQQQFALLDDLSLELKALTEQNVKRAAELLEATGAVAGSDNPAELDQAFINPVANRFGAPGRARFAAPDYDKAMERLSAAGFSAYDAEKIFAMEAEAQLRFVEAISLPDNRGSMLAQDIIGELGESLRNYMGDYGYENYLKVKGLPTAVQVQRVAGGSVGQSAGLVQGDEIVRYDGSRVFDIQGLNRVVKSGEQGDLVAVEVVRSGKSISLELPRGTIGISSAPQSPRAVFGLRMKRPIQ